MSTDGAMQNGKRSGRSPGKLYTIGEEIANSVTHGLGAMLSAAGMAIMLFLSLGDGWKIASSIVYGTTMIILYTASTLYHAITNPQAKRVLRSIDHCTIFLLIAGTYTPILLVALRGTVGWVFFGAIWASAVLGIVLNAVSIERFKTVSMVLYVVMGWAIVFTMKAFYNAVDFPCVVLMIAGGLAYTLGIIFYALKNVRYMHSIWHLFVLAGTILHFIAIALYILR